MARCKHGNQVCSQCVVVTDAAKRMSDTINGRLSFSKDWGIRTAWMAFRLSDGGSDNVVYDTRLDAISHQLHENLCAYFCFRNAMGGTNARDCQIFLDLHRAAYDSNMRLSEPQAPVMIMPTPYHDYRTGRKRG
jgi:hypothetical protein